MKKEIEYLSSPDYFNKYLNVNYNQKVNLKHNLCLRFQIFNTRNCGNAIKAIYLLESIFPKKIHCFKFKLKKKKDFTKKINLTKTLFNFDLNLNGYDFIELLRFFSYQPLASTKIVNLEYFPIINRKLKNFNFKTQLKLIPKNLTHSFNFLKLYHLD